MIGRANKKLNKDQSNGQQKNCKKKAKMKTLARSEKEWKESERASRSLMDFGELNDNMIKVLTILLKIP